MDWQAEGHDWPHRSASRFVEAGGLRWHVQQGYIVIPRSVTPARIRENIDLWHFRLDDEEMAQMAALDRGERIGPDPAVFAMDASPR